VKRHAKSTCLIVAHFSLAIVVSANLVSCSSPLGHTADGGTDASAGTGGKGTGSVPGSGGLGSLTDAAGGVGGMDLASSAGHGGASGSGGVATGLGGTGGSGGIADSGVDTVGNKGMDGGSISTDVALTAPDASAEAGGTDEVTSASPIDGTGGEGPTGTTNVLDLIPRDHAVAGWTIDPANPITYGRVAAVATTEAETENLIDGAAADFFTGSFTPVTFVWQDYVNRTVVDAPAPSYAAVSLYILQMHSAAQASGLYGYLATTPLYQGRTWTEPTSPLVGTESRIADTGDHWWINFYKGDYYVEVSLSPSYGPAPSYAIGDINTKVAAMTFAQAVANKI
jgi:hypothetical protein